MLFEPPEFDRNQNRRESILNRNTFGLSLSKIIAQKLGGDLNAKSNVKGNTFTLTYPALRQLDLNLEPGSDSSRSDFS